MNDQIRSIERTARDTQPPCNALEQALAAIWAEVIHVEAIGVEDDFFELGGNSLAGVAVVYRVREKYAVDPTLQDVFAFPTLGAFAQRIQELIAESTHALIDDPDVETGVI